jgi:hypothetical protein
MGHEYEYLERETSAFQEFCKEHDVLIDVDYE